MLIIFCEFMEIINKLLIIFYLLFMPVPVNAVLIINEIACSTSGDDWVELYLKSGDNENLNISHLLVTMYYGESEKISDDPVTIYSHDRPETPYDDRFIVVHLTDQGKSDETDLTGDADNNGYIDVYCSNYSNSLWNSDCVVAIDTDDNPSNGGMIDFAAYSSRDGSMNETIQTYVEQALACYQWSCTGSSIQECMIYTGTSGVPSCSSISRINTEDTNSQNDFEVTGFMTPGKENISRTSAGNDLFKVLRKKITIVPSHPALNRRDIPVFVYQVCSIRFRVFSDTGMSVLESPLYADVNPGNYSLPLEIGKMRKHPRTGLYIGCIEATSRKLQKTDSEKIYIIISHYTK